MAGRMTPERAYAQAAARLEAAQAAVRAAVAAGDVAGLRVARREHAEASHAYQLAAAGLAVVRRLERAAGGVG